MHKAYKGAEKQYVYAKESKREGSKVTTRYTYLGKVADRELEVIYTPERGFFTFDCKTRQYGEPPAGFVYPQEPGENMAMAFGGAFFLNAFLHRTGMMELIDSLPFGNKDSIRALVLFYVLCPLASCYAEQWYDAGIARLLYPQARLASERISELLAAVGTGDSVQNYLEKQASWVLGHLNPDSHILVGGTALENSIDIPLSAPGVHNGKVELAVRFIAVVQKGGMPLFFSPVTDSTADASTLPFVMETMKGMGIDVESCRMDAGYISCFHLDMFYDDNHKCIFDYIIMIKSNDVHLNDVIKEELSTLVKDGECVNIDNKILYLKKKKIFVGKNNDNPAWLYLGQHVERYDDELKKLPRMAAGDTFSDSEIYELFQKGRLFALVSGEDYPCGEILPKYCERQAAEQLFDFLKNYAKIIPLGGWTQETVSGHLLLSYIAATVAALVHLKLKSGGLGVWEGLNALNFLACTQYPARVVVNPLNKVATDVFKAAGIECPHVLPLAGGKLCYAPPAAVARPLEDDPVQAEPSGAERKEGQKGRRGRPKGSKNKKTLEREALAEAQAGADRQGGEAPGGSGEKRGPGRPKGSKNKKTLEREAQARAEGTTEAKPKRGPGRPKGSKNKKTLQREAELKAAHEAKYPPKRKPGRPKGSKNKKKDVDVEVEVKGEDVVEAGGQEG